MATIGLDKLYYAKITEATNGDETYAAPKVLAKAIKADLSIELNDCCACCRLYWPVVCNQAHLCRQRNLPKLQPCRKVRPLSRRQ